MSTHPTGRQAAVVFNPARVNVARLRKAITAAETTAGWRESLWLETSLDQNAAASVHAAIDAGVALVIAAGGDGTVREVGAAMRGLSVPFAVVPGGTANLLARNLGLPMNDPTAAAEIAFSGADRPIDLGWLEYRAENGTEATLPYFVMAGFGIDADMVAGTDPQLKRRFGWVAYVWPILRSLWRRSTHGVRYTVDDGPEQQSKLHSFIVGNSGTVTANLRLLPEAVLDDGMLDLLAIRSMRPRDRSIFIRWLSQSYSSPKMMPSWRIDPDVTGGALHYTQAATVTAELDRGATFQADGDSLGSVVRARFMVEPLAVTVRVPRPKAGRTH